MSQPKPAGLLAYARQNLVALAALASCAGICVVVFWLSGLPLGAVGYAGLLCLAVLLLFAVVGFIAFRRTHRALIGVATHVGVSVDGLPMARNSVEQDYQDLLNDLFVAKAESEAAAGVRQADMLDYFTMWVHQVKTPIAAMDLLLQADEASSNDDLREQLFSIERYADMVLGYLRAETMTSDLVIKECSLDGVVKQAARKYAGLFIGKQIALDYHELGVTVLTDEKWLVFVIEQLLSNALKYTSQGKVSIAMDSDAPSTLLIRDTGIGVAPEDLPRLGERGYTGFNGRLDHKSTGLGLFLCKKILAELGCSLIIESVHSQGTTAMIRFGDATHTRPKG